MLLGPLSASPLPTRPSRRLSQPRCDSSQPRCDSSQPNWIRHTWAQVAFPFFLASVALGVDMERRASASHHSKVACYSYQAASALPFEPTQTRHTFSCDKIICNLGDVSRHRQFQICPAQLMRIPTRPLSIFCSLWVSFR
jgi:hypothetical protein